MTNKLFFKSLPALIFLLSTSLYSIAQDSTKKAATKPAVTRPVQKPTTYPAAKTAVPQATTPGTVPPNNAARGYTSAQPAPPNDRSIKGQYQYLNTKVFGYQRPLVEAFYKSVTDTLKSERKKAKEAQANLTSLTDTVKDLHKQLSTQGQSLTESTEKADSISLLGIHMSKASYNSLMWGLVIVFGAVAAFVIFRSGTYSREAKYRIKLYEELDEEYKNYKIKANDKEKKLARDLQTARNKIEEITGKPDY
ncbi:hypothetical protein [Mucilaginibacter sp. KACC 22063]|uniref:hypothetical protein n=1 Tax=Mucilaginibacter sp. KACC 22063 TaxID=3025666 RepID=UPI002366803C|nr:hypothetical protein [Mucilaginibacter sp. KACC 22063]WDF54828.1 hypothetical protein PQ461_18015 [Mucilaginibacter sp. KACC 22063]